MHGLSMLDSYSRRDLYYRSPCHFKLMAWKSQGGLLSLSLHSSPFSDLTGIVDKTCGLESLGFGSGWSHCLDFFLPEPHPILNVSSISDSSSTRAAFERSREMLFSSLTGCSRSKPFCFVACSSANVLHCRREFLSAFVWGVERGRLLIYEEWLVSEVDVPLQYLFFVSLIAVGVSAVATDWNFVSFVFSSAISNFWTWYSRWSSWTCWLKISSCLIIVFCTHSLLCCSNNLSIDREASKEQDGAETTPLLMEHLLPTPFNPFSSHPYLSLPVDSQQWKEPTHKQSTTIISLLLLFQGQVQIHRGIRGRRGLIDEETG